MPCLSRTNVRVRILDHGRFPRHRRLSWKDGRVRAAGFDPEAIRAWYVRSLPLPLPFFPVAIGSPATETAEGLVASAKTSYAVGREARSFAAAFVAALVRAGAALINDPATFAQHFRKLDQLSQLMQASVPVPRTLATNDARELIEFTAEIGGPIVYKPLAGGGLCRRLGEADLQPERLDRLSSAPVLFQEEVPGINVRAYVVDGRPAAAFEIVAAALDYRGAETEVRPIDLPEEELQACVRAAEACGMRLTGIDLRRRPDGSFCVLECNPSPMFAAIERRTGCRAVSDALAVALLESAGT